MRMEYEIEEQDFYEAHQLTVRALSRYNRQLARLIVGVFSLLIPVLALLLHEFEWIYLITLPIGIVFLICPLLIRRQIHSIYSKADNIRGKIVTDIDESGIAFSSSISEGKTKWEAFQKYAEGPRVFALIYPTRIFHILPKRGLAESELDALRALITQHLPSKRA